VARKLGVKSAVIGEEGWEEADIICFNGHCSVHQLFLPEHVEFFRRKIPRIKIVVHPECSPEVCQMADFVGSTSQILKFVASQPADQPMAIGTEIHFVNRLKRDYNPHIYPLSSTRPECPSMGETRLEDLYHLLNTLQKVEKGEAPATSLAPYQIEVEGEVARKARLALNQMVSLTS
jgi:quinolinate synthase